MNSEPEIVRTDRAYEEMRSASWALQRATNMLKGSMSEVRELVGHVDLNLVAVHTQMTAAFIARDHDEARRM